MSNHIAQTRSELGLTLRELADRIGVTPGAVHQYESSERSGTIQLGTLERALNAMGKRIDVQVSSFPTAERREDRLNRALHRAVARKVLDDPDLVRSIGRRNIPLIRQNTFGHSPHKIIDEWESLLSGPPGPLLAALVDESRHGAELRQNSPFAGALTRDERVAVIDGLPR